MSMTEETFHLINTYLKGELEGESLDIFHAKLKNDESFKKAYDQQLLLIKAIENYREKELKKLLKSQGNVEYFQNIWSTKWVIASSLIVVFFSVTYIFIELGERKKSKPLGLDSVIEKTSNTSEITSPEKKTIMTEDSFVTEIVAVEENTTTKAIDSKPKIETSIPPIKEIVEEETENEDAMEKTSKEDLTEPNVEKDPLVLAEDSFLSEKNYTVSIFSLNANDARRKTKRRDNKTVKPKNTPTQDIKIEFWKSVVNFNGYKFDANKIELYGTQPESSIEVLKNGSNYYLKLENRYYKLIPNNEFQKWIPEKDPKVFKANKSEP